LKPTSLSLPVAVIALLTAAVFRFSPRLPRTRKPTAARRQRGGGDAARSSQRGSTNLKVLPKNLTGEQVHEIIATDGQTP